MNTSAKKLERKAAVVTGASKGSAPYASMKGAVEVLTKYMPRN
jgi:hypothetical protein